MALMKNITLENGIVLNYHRIVSITNITNQNSIIEVASYINEEQREKEKQWYKTNNQEVMNVFINTKYYIKDYDNDLNVKNSYDYLKTLDDFVDSENI